MKAYLIISLLVCGLFAIIFGINVFILITTAHATKNPIPDLALHGVLFGLLSFQSCRSIYHLIATRK